MTFGIHRAGVGFGVELDAVDLQVLVFEPLDCPVVCIYKRYAGAFRQGLGVDTEPMVLGGNEDPAVIYRTGWFAPRCPNLSL